MSNGIELKHPFVNKCPDIDEFFKVDNEIGVINTINSLCYKIKLLAEKYSSNYDPDKLKGDALELFVEFLIKTEGSDNRIGIYDYKTITEIGEQDVGVDGVGKGDDQNPATVQVKFRAGDYVLTNNEDQLSNFMVSSQNDFMIPVECTKNMLIITTGKKVDDFSLESMLKNKVRVLNRDCLRQMLDNRPEWWLRFYDSVKASRTQKTGTNKPIILREHQRESVEAAIKNESHKGMILLPTGTGKTIIEAEIIRLKIEEYIKKEVVPLIKINSSRILLCFQLFEEIFNYLSSYGVSCKYINNNSGRMDDQNYAREIAKLGWVYRQIESTTSVQEIKHHIANAHKEKLPVIVFSTYHSSENFAKCGYVPNVTIHDEAHNLVSKSFAKVAVLPSGESYFFTATKKVTNEYE